MRASSRSTRDETRAKAAEERHPASFVEVRSQTGIKGTETDSRASASTTAC